MTWSEAIDGLKGTIGTVKEGLDAIDGYVDRQGLADDLREQIGKHAPLAIRDELNSVVDLLDRMLNAITNDADNIPAESEAGANG